MARYEDIIEELKKIEIPITEIKFVATKNKPLPEPPYAVYYSDENQSGADDKNMLKTVYGNIDLYTSRKPDRELERKIETVLEGIEFEKNGREINNQELYEQSYTFMILQKK